MEDYFLLFFVFCTISLQNCDGCTMEGVSQWFEPQHVSFSDRHEGIIISRTTADIQGISGVSFGEGLNRGPYLEVALNDSVFTVETTDAYNDYEEHETLLAITVGIIFICTGGSLGRLTFVFNINDTNNHAPIFKPDDNFEFSLALPVPPGFLVTGCEYIIVRDIDLTTTGIEFGIQNNPYFEIVYHGPTQPKEFGAFIRTKMFIRSLPETLSLNISATDQDLTGDEPQTTTAVINIVANNSFRLPDQPVFSKAFYKADYTEDNDLILWEYITLREGYDAEVKFRLQEEYEQNFEVVDNDNQISLKVKSPLQEDIAQSQIFLVITAERELTSEASTTIIVYLPPGLELKFELPLYEGQIIDNDLKAPNLTITQGFEDVYDIYIVSEHSSYFSAIQQENIVILSMEHIPTELLQANNILNLEVFAITNRNVTTSTIVVLEIIKDDHVTPAFEKNAYNGTYDVQEGLTVEPIIFVQGFDNTVTVTLKGDYANYFEQIEQGTVVNLKASIPPEIWYKGNILVILEATKPRTVGANTAVLVNLPATRELNFEALSYNGSLENNLLSLGTIVLSHGYAADVTFHLSGEFSTYFSTNNTQNYVTISMDNYVLPENITLDNSAIILTLIARGLHAIPAYTNIILNIIKDDYITPVFEKAVYNGTYDSKTGLLLESIVLVQGYDSSTDAVLIGEHAQLFTTKWDGQTINVSGSVPAEIWQEQRLFLTVKATKPWTVGANAAILISLPAAQELGFEKPSYMGTFRNNNVIIEQIILSVGFNLDVKFEIIGEFSDYFRLQNTDNKLTVLEDTPLPENLILENNFILLTIRAYGLNAVETFTTALLEIKKDDTTTPLFSQHIYYGNYINSSTFDVENLNLIQGYDTTVKFRLEGDDSHYFHMDNMDIIENNVNVLLKSPIPEDVILNKKSLLFKIHAEKDLTVGATAVVSINFPTELTEPTIMRFSKPSYLGSLKEGVFKLEDFIVLENGFTGDTQLNLHGEYHQNFMINNSYNVITINMQNALSEEELKEMNFITLQIEASRERAVTGWATLIIDIVEPDSIVFEKSFYTGQYNTEDGLQFDQAIRLAAGFDDTVKFVLEGDDSQWFHLNHSSPNNAILNLSDEGLPQNISRITLIFSIVATKPNNASGDSIIIISITDEQFRFSNDYYKGYIEEGLLSLDVIKLQGYSETIELELSGDYTNYFQIKNDNGKLTLEFVSEIPPDILKNYGMLILTIEASANNYRTHTTIVLEIKSGSTLIMFEKPYYTGSYSRMNGLKFDSLISVTDGINGQFDFKLEGDSSIWFGLEPRNENTVTLKLTSPIPPTVIENNKKLIFVVTAARAGSVMATATIIISLTDDSSIEPIVEFDKMLYSGIIQLESVIHESITVSGYNGEEIEISGQYAEIFEGKVSEGKVLIDFRQSSLLPNTSHIVLQLQVRSAGAVLVLNILESDTPVLPTVTFGSPSYALRVESTQTGYVGFVQASSDNGEAVRYSLVLDNVHLSERLSVNNEGEIRLSAPLNSGVYSFQAVATTLITQVSATAPIHLSVEAVAICDNNIVVPPLIILDRDEEEPHRNLVVFNQTEIEGCSFTMSNIWPKEQSWLYVDEDGLHTKSIDREDDSIAFMPLSQIQVELILECEDHVTSRTKRSLSSKSTTDWLGPYEYGPNKWILTDNISYNARRSLVNLIVNDINDNVPIFAGKENEPIAVGYPVPDLEDIILPTALTELMATDADIGENSAIIYWSEDDRLAVSPSTGFVHIKNSSSLQNDVHFLVHATDQNGAGHTGDLQLVIKLLQKNSIAVLTVRDAFLEDEELILSNLTQAVGYQVKALRTVVISDSKISGIHRAAVDGSAASLQLFVYGLIEREPVEYNQLIADINNSDIVTVNVGRIISLEDHLEGNEICVLPGRDNGLLAATIVLSVLLFILIVAIVVWFYLKWKKNASFEDRDSLISQNDSIEQSKPVAITKPRLDIEELKKSERKLQERLDAPITNLIDEHFQDKPIEADVNVQKSPIVNSDMPIVIQTIDKLKDHTEDSEDDDEFGEKKKSRRKSVVTFNENVETIIHVDNEDNDPDPDDDDEVYKL